MVKRRRLLALLAPMASISIFAAFAGTGPVSIMTALLMSPLAVVALSVMIARTRPSKVAQGLYILAALIAAVQIAAVAVFSTGADATADLGVVVVPMALGVLNTIVTCGALVAVVAETTQFNQPG